MTDPEGKQVTKWKIKHEKPWKVPNQTRKEDAGREGKLCLHHDSALPGRP